MAVCQRRAHGRLVLLVFDRVLLERLVCARLEIIGERLQRRLQVVVVWRLEARVVRLRRQLRDEEADVLEVRTDALGSRLRRRVPAPTSFGMPRRPSSRPDTTSLGFSRISLEKAAWWRRDSVG